MYIAAYKYQFHDLDFNSVTKNGSVRLAALAKDCPALHCSQSLMVFVAGFSLSARGNVLQNLPLLYSLIPQCAYSPLSQCPLLLMKIDEFYNKTGCNTTKNGGPS